MENYIAKDNWLRNIFSVEQTIEVPVSARRCNPFEIEHDFKTQSVVGFESISIRQEKPFDSNTFSFAYS